MKFEFIFAFFFFIILIFFVGFNINTTISTVISDSGIDSLKSQAITIIEVLTKSGGEPEDWELSPGSTIKPGLAYSPYSLSMQKISALNSNCDLIKLLGIEDYKLVIEKGGAELLSCGSEEPKAKVRIERAVFIEDDYGKIVLELW